jgi:DNA-binding transcriptional LysR family regulator
MSFFSFVATVVVALMATVGARRVAHKYNRCTCRLRPMQLDLNLLTALDALLEEESVTGAADRLHLSAPAMSRTLGRIRQATGDQILVRSGRVMQPTARAMALRDEVRALVLRSAAVLAPEQELHLDALQRTFTVRAHDALTTALAPVLVQRVAAVAPGVRLRFLGEASGETTDLSRGVVDLEIGSAVSTSPAIDHDPVGVDELVGVARADHPMLSAPIGLEEFVAVPHVLVSRRGRLRDRVDDLLDAAGVSRTVVAAAATTGAAIAVVRATDAVVVVPESVAARFDAGVARFHLPVDLPPVPIVLSWRRQFTPDVGHHWFRTLTRDVLRAAD